MNTQMREDTYSSKGGFRESKGFAFISNKNGTCTLKSVGKCRDLDIVIPTESPDGDTVTAIGKKAFAGCKKMTSISLPDTITAIGKEAFKDCLSIRSITIPDSVTTIGKAAFSGCASLERIILPFVGGDKNATKASEATLFGYIFGDSQYKNGLQTEQWYEVGGEHLIFYLPSTLKEVSIVGGEIFRGAFMNCSNLMRMTIGDGVASIGSSAFKKCTSLTSITISDSVSDIGSDAFWDGSILQYNMYDNAYYFGNETNPYVVLVKAKSESITSCDIHENTKIILSRAFQDCTNLTRITIPHNVTCIGDLAFRGCTNLTDITILDGVTSIEMWTFSHCTSLTNITIPSSVLKVDDYAFYKCSNLQTVTFGANSQLSSIGSCAFCDCTSLTSIKIPSSVLKIDDDAFYKCSNLQTVTFGANSQLSSIGSRAFYYCTSLTSITIPDSVTSIDYGPFLNCANLTIYCEAPSKPFLWDEKWNGNNRPVIWGKK